MKFQRTIIWIVLILILVTLQTTIMPRFSILGASPNIVVAGIMVMAMWHGRLSGIWGGFFTGLLLDMYSPDGVGLQALALTVVGAFAGLFESKKISTGPLFQFFFFVLGSVVYEIVIYMNGAVANEAFVSFLLGAVIPRAIFTSVFAVLFVFLGAQLNPYGRH